MEKIDTVAILCIGLLQILMLYFSVRIYYDEKSVVCKGEQEVNCLTQRCVLSREEIAKLCYTIKSTDSTKCYTPVAGVVFKPNRTIITPLIHILRNDHTIRCLDQCDTARHHYDIGKVTKQVNLKGKNN